MKIIDGIKLGALSAVFILGTAQAEERTLYLAGYGGSTYSAIQLGGGALFGAVVSHLPDSTQLPYAVVLLVTSTVAFIVYETVIGVSKSKE